MTRWWRDIDWNWRNFGGREWFMLAMVPTWLVLSVGMASASNGIRWLAVVYAANVPGSFFLFVGENRQRQDPTLPRPEPERLDPADRPLRLALGLGFLALLTVLGLILFLSQ